jgi:DNA-directed RNA polymerase alpha subunit
MENPSSPANNSSLLNHPVRELGFSSAFKDSCKKMGYKTLGEILQDTPEVLLKKEGFNYNWLGELSKFLSEHQLIHLLQPLPGKSAH